MEKVLSFFQSHNKCLIGEFSFRFGQILFNLAPTFAVHRENSFFSAFLRSLLITCLFVYLFPFFVNLAGTRNAEWRWYLVIRVRKLSESGPFRVIVLDKLTKNLINLVS